MEPERYVEIEREFAFVPVYTAIFLFVCIIIILLLFCVYFVAGALLGL